MVVDPFTIIFDAATALTAALALFFSRIDAHLEHSAKRPDFRSDLERLSYAIGIWISDAQHTDAFMNAWAQGRFGLANIRKAHRRVGSQLESSEEVFALLRGDWDAADRYRDGYMERDEGELTSIANWYHQWKRDRRRSWQSLNHLLNLYDRRLRRRWRRV